VRIRLPDPAARDEQKYFASRERLVMMVRPHWAQLLPKFLQTLAVFIVVLLFEAVAGGSDSGGASSIPWWIALAAILRLLWYVIDWHVDHIMITDKRIMKVSGIFVRKVQAMPLTKVTDFTYSRDPTGRLLGYGEFIVESAGQDQALRTIKFLPKPDRLYQTMCDMTFGGAPSPAGDD
jgi:uncharacterized membrane protein YdbT with pleckstrin-like domain